jgi:putative oxidoreductase
MSSPPATLDSAAERTASGASSGRHELDAARPGLDTGLLVLRLVLGLTMATHGAQKLFGAFGGPGLDGTGKMFGQMGYPNGKLMATVAGLCEGGGGLALTLGLLTPLAGAALFGTMVNVLSVKWGSGFFAPAGMEYEVLLTAGAAALALTGPGRIAVDRLLPVVRTHRVGYGAGALLLAVVLAVGVLLIRH